VTLFKIIGLALIILGVLFRMISIAYFRMRAPYVHNTLAAQRAFAASKRRALWIDAAFFIAGIVSFVVR